jgi:hypothetical protein
LMLGYKKRLFSQRLLLLEPSLNPFESGAYSDKKQHFKQKLVRMRP